MVLVDGRLEVDPVVDGTLEADTSGIEEVVAPAIGLATGAEVEHGVSPEAEASGADV